MIEIRIESTKMISRKEVAQLFSAKFGIDISVDKIRKNEKRWGLDKVRFDFNKRLIFYKHSSVCLIINELSQSVKRLII
jgi:hypothetical protein